MNIFNKKTILFFSISTLMINGCVSKQELQIRPHNMAVIKVKPLISKSIWNKTLSPNIKKEDCIDCYATPMNYSKPPLATTKTIAKVIKTKRYGAYDYTETEADTTVKANNYASVNVNQYILPAVSTINSPYSSYDTYSQSTDTAIQVGAFRKYSGAKIYKKRYNALSNKYKVSIRTGTKNNKPLHRVRIEGFENKAEARKFMYSYGIRNAFLVRK